MASTSFHVRNGLMSLYRVFFGRLIDIQAKIHWSITFGFQFVYQFGYFKQKHSLGTCNTLDAFSNISEASQYLDSVSYPVFHFLRQIHIPNFMKKMVQSQPLLGRSSIERICDEHLLNLQKVGSCISEPRGRGGPYFAIA